MDDDQYLNCNTLLCFSCRSNYLEKKTNFHQKLSLSFIIHMIYSKIFLLLKKYL